MLRLRELSRRVETVLGEITEKFSTYQQQQGLNCRPGCGECCLQPTIESTPLEMLPVALYLFDQGSAEQTLYKLEAEPLQKSCVFYQKKSFDGKQGQCTVYQQRPSICRVFAAAGVRDKMGKTALSVCKVIKTDLPEQYAQSLIMITSSPPPLMMLASEAIKELDYAFGNTMQPINLALKYALEKVLFIASFSGYDDDTNIA
ncbi:YkgJ family cysteine cluster protein [Rheinheimera sp. MMS21-TC3]|uniref:YkgJ family cysteine cluster protein n=1 Tax=Rheinheimera sp. MMS21-TC3 TaxID=3072790 RepID=UPI0028C433A2|nr:YkgJ family cysteine cluster protein [Rheinheimera sp. MMS21-TC3]WNO60305.1 YkgJ family cysteine cluster protein [Rheinheimera sp. MMS21-TC3]